MPCHRKQQIGDMLGIVCFSRRFDDMRSGNASSIYFPAYITHAMQAQKPREVLPHAIPQRQHKVIISHCSSGLSLL